MKRRALTPKQEQEIKEFVAEQAPRNGADPDKMAQQMLDWTRRNGYGEFAQIKATQRALMAASRGQSLSEAQRALVAKHKENPRIISSEIPVETIVRQKKSRILPERIYTSWHDYLTKIEWRKLKRKCFDTAKRANRGRTLSAPAKHQVSGLQVWHVMRTAQGRCNHCGSLAMEGRPSNPNNGSPVAWEHVGRRIGCLEHVKARGRGGDNEFANLAWSCLLCNNWTAEQERIQGHSWRGKPDFGAIYPDLHGEPDNQKSEEIIAAKYELATGKRWSESEAFAKAVRPPQFDVDNGPLDSAEEMFPDPEYPWDVVMYRDVFGSRVEDEGSSLPIELFGRLMETYPQFDVQIVEMAAASGASFTDLRDIVIYYDGKCLCPEVEKRRLEAAKRGRKAAAAGVVKPEATQ